MQLLTHFPNIHSAFPKIEVPGAFAFIEYRAYEATQHEQAASAQHFILLILQGQQLIEAGPGRFELNADQAIFLQKGSYRLSEAPRARGLFQSVLLFITDSFMERFAQHHADLLPPPNRASAAPGVRIHYCKPIAQFYYAVLPYFNTPLNEARRRGLTLKLEELLLNLIAEEANQSFTLYLNGLMHDGERLHGH